ncbi:MAG: zinc ribbon domain-containing protein [Eubacteriaceae bacterium]|nr:zinc ribbon domain-containing protein [Eubacteriaceae bacterium]
MPEEKCCQSCAMPLQGAEAPGFGTNADGSENEDYCTYCYQEGKFTMDCTMEEMIEFCVPHMASANPDMTEDGARAMMLEFFPTLLRWRA